MSDHDQRSMVLNQEAEVVHVEHVEDLLEVAEHRTKFMDQLIQMSLARLRPGDIISIEGRPYIVADGCYKVARLWGVNIHYTGIPQKFTGKDKKGDYYFYVMTATVGLKNGETVDVVGNCSSRDPFFAKAHGEWKEVEDVDELSVMQKAQTNADRKGIAKLLGLNNITWDDVAKYAKITQADCASFSFKKPAKTATRPSEPPKSQQKGSDAPQAPADQETSQKPSDDPMTNLRNECLSLVRAAIAKDGPYKGMTITNAVKAVSGGKSSLGLCNEEELNAILDKLQA